MMRERREGRKRRDGRKEGTKLATVISKGCLSGFTENVGVDG